VSGIEWCPDDEEGIYTPRVVVDCHVMVLREGTRCALGACRRDEAAANAGADTFVDERERRKGESGGRASLAAIVFGRLVRKERVTLLEGFVELVEDRNWEKETDGLVLIAPLQANPTNSYGATPSQAHC
jgi:hypothetical protein